jgi:hypothetical protein
VQDAAYCPEIDDLSRMAVAFSNTVDHPAHEPYRDALVGEVWPELMPSELGGFLARREVVWEFQQERMAEARRKANGNQAGT